MTRNDASGRIRRRVRGAPAPDGSRTRFSREDYGMISLANIRTEG